jgi:alpha-mannosidase
MPKGHIMNFARYSFLIIPCLLSASFVLWNPATAAQEPSKELFAIGKMDNSIAELALAPDGHQRFSEDGFYAVGWSDGARDWPYVHPGPSDRWAGGRAHAFEIRFGLKTAPTTGTGRLQIDLADVHSKQPPKLRIDINGKSFKRVLFKGSGNEDVLTGKAVHGKEHVFKIKFDANLLRAGENSITITNQEGSWFLYDGLALETPVETVLNGDFQPALTIGDIQSPPVLYDDAGSLQQPLNIPLRYFGPPQNAEVHLPGQAPQTHRLESGNQMVELRMAAVETEVSGPLKLLLNETVVAEQEISLHPVRKWDVHMLHHTHLDIGYTHLQSDVEKLQWQHLEQALELAKATADYPPESRFKWIPEGLWAMEGYLNQATEKQKTAFFDAVKAGSIGLDALYGNELTALCRPEELLELTSLARRISRQYDIPIDSAMITDVPGYTWGMVPTLVQSGVRYLSIGPNSTHRIGFTRSVWSDKPFYWVSPSGKEKLLCWMAGKGYSWFHTGLNFSAITKKAQDEPILDYLNELETGDFPYDIVQIRYNIGSDNGPPDPTLPDFVRDWNERYAYPKMRIVTSSQSFHAFEERYANVIPEVSGDFTPYWEDGAASSARETSINRDAAERLVQAQSLWALLRPEEYPADDFWNAWRDVILYDEHTWGAWNSISDPESEFALGQWSRKQAFALDGEQQSRQLLARALENIQSKADVTDAVQIHNTSSWSRTDLVLLPADWKLPGDKVVDADGAPVPAQRLSTGELAFVAHDVPPLGAKQYRVVSGGAHAAGNASAQDNRISNDLLRLEIDKDTGAITQLTRNGLAGNFVHQKDGLGLNDYFYVKGRKPDKPARNAKPAITLLESGPLVATLRIESEAPGCEKLTRDVRLISGLDRVDIHTTLDKEKNYRKEGVHLAFPFNVPDGKMRIDTPWAVVHPETGQLPGSCKNYFTVQRWVDVSNEEVGVTWATVDAPLIEIGAITTDAAAVGWIETLEPSTTFYSYVMNNYWETNYKASQDGPTLFRYALRPHAAYDEAEAHRFGQDVSQPLIAVRVDASSQPAASAFRLTNDNIVLTAFKPSEKGDALLIRLFNPTSAPQETRLEWGNLRATRLEQSNLFEEGGEPIVDSIQLAPWEMTTLRAMTKK